MHIYSQKFLIWERVQGTNNLKKAKNCCHVTGEVFVLYIHDGGTCVRGTLVKRVTSQKNLPPLPPSHPLCSGQATGLYLSFKKSREELIHKERGIILQASQ